MRARNFSGEGIIDNTTWIKQTSFPSIIGQEFKASKCVLVCRSPFDVLWEKFEDKIRETKTSLGIELIKENDKLFNAFLASETEKMQIFYDYWLNVPTIPLFIISMEDIIFSPEKTLTQLFQFLFNLETLQGSQIENKIIAFLKYNKTYQTFLTMYMNEYKPDVKSYTHIHLKNYTLLQKNITLKVMRDVLTKVGYINEKQAMTFRDDKGFDETEMKAALDAVNAPEKWYQEHNKAMIEHVHKEHNEKRKYCLLTSLKVNSKKTLLEKED